MRVTQEIEVGQIRNRVRRPARWHLACAYETSEALRHLDVREVGRVKLVLISKETGLDPGAKRSLEQKLQQRRGVDDDHADSRSARIATAAGVFNDTPFRLWIRVRISDLQLAVQRVGHMPDLDHLRHANSMFAC